MKEIRDHSNAGIILTGKTELLGLTKHIRLCYKSIEEKQKEVSKQQQNNLHSLL